MVYKELYRIMIKERFLNLLIVLVLVKLAVFSTTDYAYTWKSETETDFYKQYMEEISGELEKWKIQKIENDYKNTEIMGQHYSVMEEVYSDYQYVLKSPESHYFLTNDGFELFMLHMDIDWILLFLIVLLSLQLISKDYASGVIQITQTSKLGRGKFATVKAGIMLVTTMVMSIVFQLLQIICYGATNGLASFDAPIQSIQAFENLEKELTVVQAWICVVILRMVAYIIFGMIVFGIAAFCKNSAFCIFIGVGIVFLPLYLLSGTYHQEIIYQTLTPVGTLNGYGFLLGSNKPDLELDYFFQELYWTDIISIYIVQLFIGIIIMAMALIKISGKRINSRKLKQKGVKLCILGIFCSLLVCGCVSGNTSFFQMDTMSGRDLVTNKYVKIDEYNFYDIEEGKTYQIGETILDNEKILAIGDSYIMVARKEINGILTNEFSIELLDYERDDRYTLIRFGKNADQAALLGLDNIINTDFLNRSGRAIENMGINESVVLENNCIYYAYNNVVVCADCNKNEYSIIYQDSEMKNTIIAEGRIYYVNGLEQLIYYNMITKEAIVLGEDISQVWMDDIKVFISKTKEEGLFMISKEELLAGSDISWSKISDITPDVLDTDRNIAVFQSEGNFYMYSYKEEKPIEKKLDIEVAGNLAGISNNKIYVLLYEGEKKVLVYDLKK